MQIPSYYMACECSALILHHIQFLQYMVLVTDAKWQYNPLRCVYLVADVMVWVCSCTDPADVLWLGFGYDCV